MTTCKHCGKRRENHYEKIDGRACCNPNGKGTVFEPSTEGTQPVFRFFRCMSCGFNGQITTDEIAKHRAQCSHGATVPMSQAEWEARGGPAPVAQVDAPVVPGSHREWKTIRHHSELETAQVDAGKYDFAKVRSQHFTEIAEEYEPAVAQTELPPIPEHSKLPWRSVYPVGSKQRCAAVESAGDGVYVYLLVAHPDDTQGTINRWQADADFIVEACNNFASLTQRLQESEAREAELKAEIERLKLSQPGTASLYVPKAAYEVLQGKMEALERSHKALLDSVEDILGYTGGADSALEDEYVMERLHASWAVAQKLAAEKL